MKEKSCNYAHNNCGRDYRQPRNAARDRWVEDSASAGAPRSDAIQRNSMATSCADWVRSAGIFRQASTNHHVEHGRGERLVRGDGFRLFLQDRSEYAELRFALEGTSSGNHFVENAAEAEQVATRVRLRSLQNFRSHVLAGANHRTFLGNRRRGRA